MRVNPRVGSIAFANLVRTSVLLCCLGSAASLHAQDMPEPSHGTVNIALANANGLVLLTDSVQTVQKSDGPHYQQPVQKLFRLDDKTVCSIAGFASETGWVHPEFNTDVAGIIADFKDQLSAKPVPELDAKLRGIAYLVSFYIEVVANRREVAVGSGTPISAYLFEVIVAGYDVDGKPKVKKLVITPVVLTARDGHHYWSTTISNPEAQEVDRKLVPVFGGIKQFSNAVWNTPQKYDADIVRRYIAAKARDGGESLTLDEMAALASYMAAQTAKALAAMGFPAVGGPDQIAILSKGSITKFDQPSFPDPPRPLSFVLMVHLKVTTQVPILPNPGVHLLWIRSKFVGMVYPGLELDGNFYYGCEVDDSVVSYSGGLTDFDSTNTVVNSWLMWGSAAYPEGDRISERFKWRAEDDPPHPPPLPPTIEPL